MAATASRRTPLRRDIREIGEGAAADLEGLSRFSEAMRDKLAQKRTEGRGGWNHAPYNVQRERGERCEFHGCSVRSLKQMLRNHMKKGDMVDIANFAMMIWNRENPTGPRKPE